jgi:MFS family permease
VTRWLKGTFRSLNNRNYRIWASGAFLSNVGTWMQRIAQDWVVLTQLTHNSPTAVGIVMAARQTFITALVNEADLPNAVALNSTSFNAARLIGPAVAGVLIAAVGSGWVFLINAASFAAVLFSLCLLQTAHQPVKPNALRTTNGVIDGFRYVANGPI